MTARRLDEILAQTDPFDLSLGVDRYVSSLDSATICELVAGALDRSAKCYRDELSFLLDPGLSDEALRRAFIRFLKANLRAIALFDTSFGDGVLKACPKNSIAAIEDELAMLPEQRAPNGNARAAVIVGTVIALLFIGAAAEHAVMNARAAGQGPQRALPFFARISTSATSRPKDSRTADRRRTRYLNPPVQHAAVTQAPAAPGTFEGATAAPADNISHVVAAPQAPRYAQTPVAKKVPETRGNAIDVSAPTSTPDPDQTPIDVTDMPDAYSDATPLPEPSNATADPQTHEINVVTPKPTAKPRRGMLNHLDPFQPGGHIRIP